MKLPVSKEITAVSLLSLGIPCEAGQRYFEERFGDRASGDRATFERVLGDHPGCVFWILDRIALAYADHRGLGYVARGARDRLFDLDIAVGDDVKACALKVHALFRNGMPLSVRQALYMCFFLRRTDAIRRIALEYFDIPEATQVQAEAA